MKRTRTAFMPFFGDDAYGDEFFNGLEWAEQGFYLWLAWWQWQEGSIPHDFARLLVRMPASKVKSAKKLWPRMCEVFVSVDGGARRFCESVEKKRAAFFKTASDKSFAGKRGAEARWGSAIDSEIADAMLKTSAPMAEGEGNVSSALDRLNRSQSGVAQVLEAFAPGLRPHPGLIAKWVSQIGAVSVVEIVQKYPTKNADYIAKCVQSAARDRAKTQAEMAVGAQKEDHPHDELLRLIEDFIAKNGPRPTRDQVKKVAWEAEFLGRFGFAADDWNGHTDHEICAEWLLNLKVKA